MSEENPTYKVNLQDNNFYHHFKNRPDLAKPGVAKYVGTTRDGGSVTIQSKDDIYYTYRPGGIQFNSQNPLTIFYTPPKSTKEKLIEKIDHLFRR